MIVGAPPSGGGRVPLPTTPTSVNQPRPVSGAPSTMTSPAAASPVVSVVRTLAATPSTVKARGMLSAARSPLACICISKVAGKASVPAIPLPPKARAGTEPASNVAARPGVVGDLQRVDGPGGNGGRPKGERRGGHHDRLEGAGARVGR